MSRLSSLWGAKGARRWWLVCAVLVLVAAVCLPLGLRTHRHPLPGPVASSRPATSTPVPAPKVAVAAEPRSVPITLGIPTIGVSVPLSQLGLNADGTVQVPTDFQEPGWYNRGPSPGQTGSAVILGHVDSYLGPAVFFEIRTLEAGDLVDVSLADNDVAQFVVETVTMYQKTAFPDQLVYGPHGYSALELVTCGGTFDSQTGSYLSNIVVSTKLLSITPTAPAAVPTVPAVDG